MVDGIGLDVRERRDIGKEGKKGRETEGHKKGRRRNRERKEERAGR